MNEWIQFYELMYVIYSFEILEILWKLRLCFWECFCDKVFNFLWKFVGYKKGELSGDVLWFILEGNFPSYKGSWPPKIAFGCSVYPNGTLVVVWPLVKISHTSAWDSNLQPQKTNLEKNKTSFLYSLSFHKIENKLSNNFHKAHVLTKKMSSLKIYHVSKCR